MTVPPNSEEPSTNRQRRKGESGAAHPEMSTRELGAALGVNHDTIASDRKVGVGNPTEPAEQEDGDDHGVVGNPTPTPATAHVANNSGDNEWYTPEEYVAAPGNFYPGV